MQTGPFFCVDSFFAKEGTFCMPLKDTEKMILNRIQSDFPICSRPYQAIGAELGLTEKQVIDCLFKLKQNGIIRRIGGNFRPEKLGFFSTLCAAKVSSDKIGLFAETVNYQRNNDYNVWFTFIASSREEIVDSLAEISRLTGVTEILNLPATRLFKIKAHFHL
jgi:DNA-binding Lrp family transcriptional regulator